MTITVKNFSTKLSGVIKSASSMRDNLQALLLFAMDHYGVHKDTTYLTRCMAACVGVKALPTQKMKEYIQAHVNVTYREIEVKKGKDKGKKVRVFKMKGTHPEFTIPSVPWYAFSKAGDVVTDLDVDARVTSFVKALENKLKEEKVTNKKHATEAIAALNQLKNRWA